MAVSSSAAALGNDRIEAHHQRIAAASNRVRRDDKACACGRSACAVQAAGPPHRGEPGQHDPDRRPAGSPDRNRLGIRPVARAKARREADRRHRVGVHDLSRDHSRRRCEPQPGSEPDAGAKCAAPGRGRRTWPDRRNRESQRPVGASVLNRGGLSALDRMWPQAQARDRRHDASPPDLN
jgi:hypothetical protein